MLTILTIIILVLLLTDLALVWELRREKHLTDRDRDQTLAQWQSAAQANFTEALSQSSRELVAHLHTVAQQATAQLDSSLRATIDREVVDYQTAIKQAREKALADITVNRDSLVDQQRRVDKDVDVAIEQYKQATLAKVETKLNSILSSYLLKSLGPIDFSAQQDYIFKTLNENKETLRRDINNVR